MGGQGVPEEGEPTPTVEDRTLKCRVSPEGLMTPKQSGVPTRGTSVLVGLGLVSEGVECDDP